MPEHISIAPPSRDTLYIYPKDFENVNSIFQDWKQPQPSSRFSTPSPPPAKPKLNFLRRPKFSFKKLSKKRSKPRAQDPLSQPLKISGPISGSLGQYLAPAFHEPVVPSPTHPIPSLPNPTLKPRVFRESFFPRKSSSFRSNTSTRRSFAVPSQPPKIRAFRESFFPRKSSYFHSIPSKPRSPTPKPNSHTDRPRPSRFLSGFHLSRHPSTKSKFKSNPSRQPQRPQRPPQLSEPLPSNWRTSDPTEEGKPKLKFKSQGAYGRNLMLSLINDVRLQVSEEAEGEAKLGVLRLDSALVGRCVGFARKLEGSGRSERVGSGGLELLRDEEECDFVSGERGEVARLVPKNPYTRAGRRGTGPTSQYSEISASSEYTGRTSAISSTPVADQFLRDTLYTNPAHTMEQPGKHISGDSSNYGTETGNFAGRSDPASVVLSHYPSNLPKEYSVASLTPAPLSLRSSKQTSTASESPYLPINPDSDATTRSHSTSLSIGQRQRSALQLPSAPYPTTARLISPPSVSAHEAVEYWYSGKFTAHDQINRSHKLPSRRVGSGASSTSGVGESGYRANNGAFGSGGEEFYGRKLGFAHYGNKDEPQLFYLHRLPGSRFEGKAFYEKHLDKYNAGLICVERPGIGLSSPHPGPTACDHTRDVLYLATHLSLNEWRVIGISGGAPYALACALIHPSDRLRGVTICSGSGPYHFGYHGMAFGTKAMLLVFRFAP
ncbi:hypothetical protein MBLNU230_g3852t1 [Neophaeotheca triangularis]